MNSVITPLRTALAVSLLALFMMLSGCGQKGPLYLPDEDEQESEEQVVAPASQRIG